MLTHLSIDIFPIVVLAIIYMDNQKKVTRVADKWLLGILALLAAVLMVVNAAVSILAGPGDMGSMTGLWFFCILQGLLPAALAGVWLLFVCSRLLTGARKRAGQLVIRIMAGMSAVYLVLLFTTPWSRLLFWLAEEAGYRRGPGWWLAWGICAVFLAEACGISRYLRSREPAREQRLEEGQLCVMSLGILAAVTIDFWCSGWWLTAPAVSLVLLALYMNRQNHQITTDGLTGLNNRRRFDQELHRRAEQPASRPWGMLMVDIDDFKWINDNLGHVVGDEALKETAGILRRTFAHDRAFLARYGGDEFVVVENFRDENAAKGAAARIERERVRFNAEGGRDYQISLSIGYALWSEVSHEAPERIVNRADERMYEIKQKHKAAAGKS